MSKHTPGPDERGNYWMDCGCMVNRIQQQRCRLHHAAPDLLVALEKAQGVVLAVLALEPKDFNLEGIRETGRECNAAIAAAKGEGESRAAAVRRRDMIEDAPQLPSGY